MAGSASGDKGAASVEKDAPLASENGFGPSDAAISESYPGELQSTMAEKGSDGKGSAEEAESLAGHNSSWEVNRNGNPRQKLVASDHNMPRKIRNKLHNSGPGAAADGHTKQHAVHEKEHHQVARTPAAEALAPMEAPTGTVSSKAELKAHLQEVNAAHQKESRYTAKLWHNDPAAKLPGYTKSMRNMIGDDRRAHYGVPQSRRTQA